jgi:acetyltransferase-like isoleucine patch superfamily enzyme
VTKDIPRDSVALGVPAKVVMGRKEYDRKQKGYLETE